MEGKLYFWKKKFGDIHISGTSTTYCGLPMLGNNYATQEEVLSTCAKCIQVLELQEEAKNKK